MADIEPISDEQLATLERMWRNANNPANAYIVDDYRRQLGAACRDSLPALLARLRQTEARIAALEASLAAAHAAIRVGDGLAAPLIGLNGKTQWCRVCDASWQSLDRHFDHCPIPAWRTARAAVKMEGDDAKG